VKILLLSSYHAESHHYWASGLIENLPEHDFTLLSLPARHFSWRVRGNSLSWALEQREALEAGYDLLLCTSMTDLSALRGMVPSLTQLPTVVYFHENQFAYPSTSKQQGLVEAQLTSIYTALCADKIAFNSEWNRSSFIAGAAKLLKKMPDHCPHGTVIEQISSKTQLLPVPLKPPSKAVKEHSNNQLQVLWNHRWEYDKGPEILLATVKACDEMELNLDWHIVGQQFRQQPAEFAEIEQQINASESQQLLNWGYAEDPEKYAALLNRADVVLSTALHDFQGLAILDAVQAGCLPLLPDRLCYSEWFASEHLVASSADQPSTEGRANAQRLADLIDTKPLVPALHSLSWQTLKPQYQSLLQAYK
jgi:glycosyltransferase involved in cell wall biosynthesis